MIKKLYKPKKKLYKPKKKLSKAKKKLVKAVQIKVLKKRFKITFPLKKKKKQPVSSLITILKKSHQQSIENERKRKQEKWKWKYNRRKSVGQYYSYIVMPVLYMYKRMYAKLARKYYTLNFLKYKRPNHKMAIRVKSRKRGNTALLRYPINGVIRLEMFNFLKKLGRVSLSRFKFVRSPLMQWKRRKSKPKAKKVFSLLRLLALLHKSTWKRVAIKYFRVYRRFQNKIIFDFYRMQLRNRARTKLINLRFRRLSRYGLIIRRVYNNTFLTICDIRSGDVYEKASGGLTHMKGSKRSTYVAVEKITNVMVRDALRSNLFKRKFDIYLRTRFFDKSVKNVVKILKETRMRAYGRGFKKRRLKKIKIRNLIVNRRVCHNGIRGTKPRRV